MCIVYTKLSRTSMYSDEGDRIEKRNTHRGVCVRQQGSVGLGGCKSKTHWGGFYAQYPTMKGGEGERGGCEVEGRKQTALGTPLGGGGIGEEAEGNGKGTERGGERH